MSKKQIIGAAILLILPTLILAPIYRLPVFASSLQQETLDVLFVPIETSVPRDDGSIIHIVGDGQTLWTIALSYGVTIYDICLLNDITYGTTVIQVGRKLLIRPINTNTAVVSNETLTQMAPLLSPTTTLSVTPLPPSQTATPTHTITPTHIPFNINSVLSDDKTICLTILLIATIGLLIAFMISFRKPRFSKPQRRRW